jgi:hypothetical protein
MGTSTSKTARSTSHQSASARQSATDHPGNGSSRAAARGRQGPEVGAASIGAGAAGTAGAHPAVQASAHRATNTAAITSAQQPMRTFLGQSSEGEWHPELHGNGLTPFDPMQRHEMISQAAYFIAQRRDFADGGADDDWLQAELEIDRMLSQGGVQATGPA